MYNNWVRETFDYMNGELYWKYLPNNEVDIDEPAGKLDKYSGHVIIGFKGRIYKRSFLVFCWNRGRWPHVNTLSHINGDTSDDRIENLKEKVWKKQKNEKK